MAYVEVDEPIVLDSTGQDIKDSLDDIKSAVQGLGTALGSDRALIDGSNIANPSTFRQNIGAQATINSITVTTTKKQLAVPVNTDKSAPDFGFAECYGGTQGTTLTVESKTYTISPSVTLRVPLAKGDTVRYTGGGYTTCNIFYQELSASITT